MTTNVKSPNTNNGARAKILRAIYQHGMLPIVEISEQCGLTGKQARDNVCQARVEGLLSAERDDVTGGCSYKITAAGKKWVEERPNFLKGEHDVVTPTDTRFVSVEPAEILVLSPPVDPIELKAPTPLTIPIDKEETTSLPEAAGANTRYAAVGLEGGLHVCKTLEEAIAAAKEISEHDRAESPVYRLVKIGETRTTIEFVEDPA